MSLCTSIPATRSYITFMRLATSCSGNPPSDGNRRAACQGPGSVQETDTRARSGSGGYPAKGLQHQSNSRPLTAHRHSVTAGGTPAQLFTFRPPGSTRSRQDPGHLRSAPGRLREGTQFSCPRQSHAVAHEFLIPPGSPGETLAYCGTNLTVWLKTRNPRRAGARRHEPAVRHPGGRAAAGAYGASAGCPSPLSLRVAARMLFCRSLSGWPPSSAGAGRPWPVPAWAALAAACRTQVSRGGAARGVVRVSSFPRWLAWATRKPGYCGLRPSLARAPSARCGGRRAWGQKRDRIVLMMEV